MTGHYSNGVKEESPYGKEKNRIKEKGTSEEENSG